jgi:hypothetical protein
MDQIFRVSPPANAPEPESRAVAHSTPIGASYGFDPGADGLASIYASRIVDRGGDPRALCADVRADRLGTSDRARTRRALLARSRTARFGRGTASHLFTTGDRSLVPAKATPTRRTKASPTPGTPRQWFGRVPRRLAVAGMAALILLPVGAILAGAQALAP